MKPIRTTADLSNTVVIGVTTESLHLEFKREEPAGLKSQKQQDKIEAQMELVADIIQFANAEGGVIVYGIDEGPGPTPGLKTAKAIAPVKSADQLKEWIEQFIKKYAVPSTFSKDVVAIDAQQGAVVAVNVPPSRHLVSIWDREQHTIKYPKRTSFGQGWMNPDEAERHLMDGSRATRIALVDACMGASQDTDGNIVEIIDGFYWSNATGQPQSRVGADHVSQLFVYIAKIEDYSFNLKVVFLGKHYVFSLPFGVVHEAWRTPTNRVGLMLDVIFVVQSGTRDIWFVPRK